MKETLSELLADSIDRARGDGTLPLERPQSIQLEVPKDSGFGDYASNLAMILAKSLKRPPREIAGIVIDHINDPDGVIDRCEVAGPGFINFFLRDACWVNVLKEIDSLADAYGHSDLGKGVSVLIEFVSANPTGPLHVGHGRGAVVGDALARILVASGYHVTKEFYINDAGRQLKSLGRSILVRYRQLFDENVSFPDEGLYPGEYIMDIAKQVRDQEGDLYLNMDEEMAVSRLSDYGAGLILKWIQTDLAKMDVSFDTFFSERTLFQDKKVEACIEELEEKDLLYREENGALVLKTSELGDDKDRVLIKGDGDYTYFASDIAYHREKFERKFERLINIWGADHHGYIPRMKSAVRALGHDADTFQVLLIQMVNLLREGKPVRMGKRTGEFVTLSEVTEEVGNDVARFFFLQRRSDSHLDFDLDLAKTQSNENPVYYVQYAHARICSVFRQAQEREIPFPTTDTVKFDLLSLPEEKELMKLLGSFPEIVEGAALSLEPHRIPFYLQELATRLHAYYFKHRIITEDLEKTQARLFLVGVVRTVIKNALTLMGVSAPERM